MKKFLIFLIFLSCSSSNFFQEGENKSHQLVDLLKKVESREDLLYNADLLERKFQELVDVMIAAHKYAEKHPQANSLGVNAYSDRLMQEFKRIYSIEGCRESMENIQREPLIRLDAYLKKRKKEKTNLMEAFK